jgi:Spy/CpxP family protein refolding chaperone
MKAKLVAQNQVMTVLTPQQKTDIQAKLQALEDKMAAKFKSCHEQDGD